MKTKTASMTKEQQIKSHAKVCSNEQLRVFVTQLRAKTYKDCNDDLAIEVLEAELATR